MISLVIACRFHPEPLLVALLGLLAPSRPIVVYCHLLEVRDFEICGNILAMCVCSKPLVECYKTLKGSEQELVFDVQISETWTRYYQV